MNKDLKLLVLFGIYVALFPVWFLSTSGELLTFIMGASMGVGLVGMAMSALKLFRPDKYRFIYELDADETTLRT